MNNSLRGLCKHLRGLSEISMKHNRSLVGNAPKRYPLLNNRQQLCNNLKMTSFLQRPILNVVRLTSNINTNRKAVFRWFSGHRGKIFLTVGVTLCVIYYIILYSVTTVMEEIVKIVR